MTDHPRIAVFGCGAIGSLLAARLCAANFRVTVFARGAQREALLNDGLTLLEGETERRFRPGVGDLDSSEPFDVVFLTLKAHALESAAADIASLLHYESVVVTFANGMPWWYAHGVDWPLAEPWLDNVDPAGLIWETLEPERALGGVVYPAARLEAPGVVRWLSGDRFAVGEPTGRQTGRLEQVRELLAAAGFDADDRGDLRSEIWLKLMANTAYNPVSVITGGTLGDMLDAPATRELLAAVMNEVAALAASLGVTVPMSVDELLTATEPFAAHKTSMLQDLEAGRALELDALVSAPAELAARLGVPTPGLDTVLPLARARSLQGKDRA